MAIVQLLSLHPRPVTLRLWLEDRVSQFNDQADRREIALHTEAPDVKAVFDANSLGRALDNLILTALQHTPAGGEIGITGDISEGKLRLCVEDSGSGVLEHDRGQIFEPFMTTRADGSGLGLAIVREIVEAHGGGVRCGSGRQGARFEMELPWHTS